MTFEVSVNSDWLWRSPDGREAWVIFSPAQKVASIVTDPHQQGQPNNAVGFTAEALREIADRLDQRAANPGGSE